MNNNRNTSRCWKWRRHHPSDGWWMIPLILKRTILTITACWIVVVVVVVVVVVMGCLPTTTTAFVVPITSATRRTTVQFHPIRLRVLQSDNNNDNNNNISRCRVGRLSMNNKYKNEGPILQNSNSTDVSAAARSAALNYAYYSPSMTTTSPSKTTTTKLDDTGPFPAMPSQTFFHLANSQFELLANSLQHHIPINSVEQQQQQQQQQQRSKIKSMALYLPQENPTTGQLEFLPSVVYPCPTTERVFIASDADSGVPPTMPATLTKLPGFANAQTLIPTYPFTANAGGSSSSESGGSAVGVGVPEEVLCDVSSTSEEDCKNAALSLPLFLGSQTIGVLLVWPTFRPITTTIVTSSINKSTSKCWSDNDIRQISRAGETLALALSMDSERYKTNLQTEQFRVALEDSLHQVKNPIQAMRTFSKLLQRTIVVAAAEGSGVGGGEGGGLPRLSTLAANIVEQGDRVVDLLLPMDSIVNTLEGSTGEEGGGQQQQQLLLAPMQQRDLILRPKSMQRRPIHMGQRTSSTDTITTTKTTTTMMTAPLDDDKTTKVETRLPPPPYLGDIDIEMAFVSDVLEPILLASKALALERGIDFDVLHGIGDDSELPGVLLCPRSLQEAVLNGLDNAIKYVKYGESGMWGEENRHPKIRVSLVSNDDNDDGVEPGVTIWIEDNGPGIKMEERGSVFVRGYRSDAARVASVGSGIGLDISKAMISRMGGTLEFVDDGIAHLGGAVLRIVLFRNARNNYAG